MNVDTTEEINQRAINQKRQAIKDGIDQLEDKHRSLFKQMYSHSDREKGLHDIIDDMPESKLDQALNQITRTLQKVNK